jgi:hypothetical protein
MGSAYLGGAFFFIMAVRERRWTAIKSGFPSVAIFATLLGIATIIHWDKFNHGHVAFWLWTGLYFTTPFLVVGAWLANQRHAAPASLDDLRLNVIARWCVALVGVLALGQGIVMFLTPDRMIDIWPWTLTPLTCRVVGAVFCLGSAGIAVLVDPRWLVVKLMLEVEAVMVGLMLVGAIRARSEFDTGRLLTWLLLVGLTGVLLGSAYIWYDMEIRAPSASRADYP